MIPKGFHSRTLLGNTCPLPLLLHNTGCACTTVGCEDRGRMHTHARARVCVCARWCRAGALGKLHACVCAALAMCVSGHVWDLAAPAQALCVGRGCFAQHMPSSMVAVLMQRKTELLMSACVCVCSLGISHTLCAACMNVFVCVCTCVCACTCMKCEISVSAGCCSGCWNPCLPGHVIDEYT